MENIRKQIQSLRQQALDVQEATIQAEKKDAEYKIIDIIVSNEKKIIDIDLIRKMLTIDELKAGVAEDIYSYLEEVRDIKEIILKENEEFVNYLFINKILIPISEDFVRFHKDTEKYDPESLAKENPNIRERDATKIKYIINKMNLVRNYYSEILDKNVKLKVLQQSEESASEIIANSAKKQEQSLKEKYHKFKKEQK